MRSSQVWVREKFVSVYSAVSHYRAQSKTIGNSAARRRPANALGSRGPSLMVVRLEEETPNEFPKSQKPAVCCIFDDRNWHIQTDRRTIIQSLGAEAGRRDHCGSQDLT